MSSRNVPNFPMFFRPFFWAALRCRCGIPGLAEGGQVLKDRHDEASGDDDGGHAVTAGTIHARGEFVDDDLEKKTTGRRVSM